MIQELSEVNSSQRIYQDLVSWGVSSDFLKEHPNIIRQLQNGAISDYVRLSKKIGDIDVYTNVALRLDFRYPVPRIKVIPVERKLSLPDDLSNRMKENLLEGLTIGGETYYSYANAGSPIKVGETYYLVSIDPFKYNSFGEVYRGTNKYFIEKCSEVYRRIRTEFSVYKGHEFTDEEIRYLSEGKDLFVGFSKGQYIGTSANIQYDVVQRRIVEVNTPLFREAKNQIWEKEWKKEYKKVLKDLASDSTGNKMSLDDMQIAILKNHFMKYNIVTLRKVLAEVVTGKSETLERILAESRTKQKVKEQSQSQEVTKEEKPRRGIRRG